MKNHEVIPWIPGLVSEQGFPVAYSSIWSKMPACRGCFRGRDEVLEDNRWIFAAKEAWVQEGRWNFVEKESLGARGSAELRPDNLFVESFSATQRESRAGSWSPLRATMTEILALSLTIANSVGSCKHLM
jgi:hypothetical protein